MDRRRIGATLAVLALVALAGCGGVTTTSVCGDCVTAVETVAYETDRDIAVTESVTHVYVNASGDAFVEARLHLDGANVSDLAANETLVRSVLDRINGSGRRAVRPTFEPRGLDGHLEDRTFVVTYSATDVADRRVGGTVFSDRFYRNDDEGPYSDEPNPENIRVDTDRLVVHSPDGTAPVVIPPGATVNGTTLIYGGEWIPDRTYLVFGSDGRVGRLQGRAAIAVDVFRWAGPDAARGAGIPTVMLFGLAAAFSVRYTSRSAGDGEVHLASDRLVWTLGGCFAVVASIVAGLFVLGSVLVPYVVLAVVGVVMAILKPWDASGGEERARTSSRDGFDDGRTGGARGDAGSGSNPTPTDGSQSLRERSLAVVPGRDVVTSVAVTVFAGTAILGVVATDFTGRFAGQVALVGAALPLVTFPALGYLVTQPNRSVARAVTVTVTGVSPAVFAFAWTVDAGGTAGTELGTFLWGVLVTLVGTVCFYLALWLSS